MVNRRSTKTKRIFVDPVAKELASLKKSILEPMQARNCAFKAVNVANHSEADQRASVRSKETRTLRKLTRVELLTKAGVITPDQAHACEWYSGNYELGFQTIGCTANYTGSGGGGFGASDLLSRYKAQAEARENYHYARLAIPSHLLGTFESIILGTGRPPHMLPKVDKTRFSLAAFLLHEQVGHMLSIAA